MNTKHKASIFTLAYSLILASCGAPKIISTPIENIDNVPLKTASLSDTQLKHWNALDLIKDTIPGMSVDKAYNELIKNKKGQSVIVAVIDSGVDVEHEDLKGSIWTNKNEIKGNGKDDDNNGYIDDIYGWNFLGDIVTENLEFVRILKQLKPKYEGKDASTVSAEDQKEFALYQKAAAEYEKEYNEALQNKNRYELILQQVSAAHKEVSAALGKENYTKEELLALKPSTEGMKQNIAGLTQMFSYVDPGQGIPDIIKDLKEGIDHFAGSLNGNLNLDSNYRAVLGDNPDDFSDKTYGDNNVMGPDRESTKHGTHVAGIIAANRKNKLGGKGVANNVKIMTLRAVPDGDEYDKDIALSIRYAVDNGAKVINTSFGKYYSTHPEWVYDAIKYAAEKDVLIVNAAGNDSSDLDSTQVYPNDQTDNTNEISDTFLTVGALNYKYGSDLVASFSNYGKHQVDVFAPGVKIYATTPSNTYSYLQGTSMAAPGVAGVAALIRSHYPKLSAAQVKKIIMDSGLTSTATVVIGGDTSHTGKFTDLSTSGKMVNLYNAMILAEKISK